MSYLNSNGVRCLVVVAQMGLLISAGASFAATGKVYVADEESSTVSVIDAESFKKIGSMAVGPGPHNVQVAPAGRKLIRKVRGPNGVSVTPLPQW